MTGGTKSPKFRKEVINSGEPHVSLLISSSEHGTAAAPPQISNAYTGGAGFAGRAAK